MRKLLLTIALFAFVPFVHAYNPSNMVGEGAAWYTKDDGSYMTMRFFSLRHDKTTLYCTGWVLQSDYDEWDRNRDIPGHVATRNDLVEWFSKKTSTSGFPSSFDGDNNGLPDWRELIAGGEYLYWKDLGNGWQFYVNGQMMACNSDTNWENTLFKDLPPSSAQQYPDENHNGIPDIVDAAIAAGGGATSEGGNITVTVENKNITVNVDNAPVLQAITGLSEQIAQIQTVGGTGGGNDKDYTEILTEIRNKLGSLYDSYDARSYSANTYLEQIKGWLYDFGTEWNDHAISIQTTGDLQLTELENIADTLTLIENHIASAYPIFATHLDTIAQESQNQTQLLQSINQYLTVDQKERLDDIKSNTQGTVQRLATIIEILNRLDNTQFGGIENKPEMEEADDIVSESSEGVDEKKREFEEEDKGEGEDDSNKIKDNDNVDKKTGSERIRDKIFRALGVDLNHLRQSSQEDEQITLKISNEKMVAAIGKRVPTATLNMSLHLDPRKWTGGGNWHESDNLQGSHAATIGTFSEYVVPYMDVARGLCLFVFGWAFIGSLFDLFRDAWSY